MNETNFSQHLGHMNKGSDDRYLTELLRKVTAAVKATGKKGSVTLTLDITTHEGSDTMMQVKPKITFTLPQPRRAASFMYALPDGTLVRDDPDQEVLDLVEVPQARQDPPIEIGEPT